MGRLDRVRGVGGAIAAGSASAALNAIAGLSGPPVAIYASSVSKRAVRWAVLIASAAGGVTAIGFGVFAVLHPG